MNDRYLVTRRGFVAADVSAAGTLTFRRISKYSSNPLGNMGNLAATVFLLTHCGKPCVHSG